MSDLDHGFFHSHTRQTRTALVISSATLFTYTFFGSQPETVKLFPSQFEIPGSLLYWGLLVIAVYFFISFYLAATAEYERYDYQKATKKVIEELSNLQNRQVSRNEELSGQFDALKKHRTDYDLVRVDVKDDDLEFFKQQAESFSAQKLSKTAKALVELVRQFDLATHDRDQIIQRISYETERDTREVQESIKSLEAANLKHSRLEGRRLKWLDYKLTLWVTGAGILTSLVGWSCHLNLYEWLTSIQHANGGVNS